MRRTAKVDTVLAKNQSKRVTKVGHVGYASGNRAKTPSRNANSFFDRSGQCTKHLSFGFGLHRCIGQSTAEDATSNRPGKKSRETFLKIC